MARDFKTIGVVGLGTMGAGITEVFARNGYTVVGVEVDDDGVDARTPAPRALDGSRGRARQADRGGREGSCTTGSASPPRWRSSRTPTSWSRRSWSPSRSRSRSSSSSRASSAEDTILATNTSSLSVTEISTANSQPGRVIGVHFFNPAPVQGFVEIVRTVVDRAGGARGRLRRWSRRSARTPSSCGDKAGFIANTLLFGYLNHAVSMYEDRYASREDIDAAMRFGCGYPMGPLALLDLIGLDTAYEILETMYRQGRDRLHAPGADPQADGHRRACSAGRPAGASTPTRRPTARSSSPTTRRPRPTTSPSSSTTSTSSASSAPARWRPASSRSSPRAGTTSSTSAARRTRSTASATTIERSLDKAIQRGKLEESAKERGARPAHRLHLARRPRPGRHRGRGDRRGPEDQDHAVREPRRDLQARRHPRHHDVLAADHRVRAGDQAARRTSSGCTSSTRRRS